MVKSCATNFLCDVSIRKVNSSFTADPEEVLKNQGRTASVATLGCRLNQSESLMIKDRLKKSGYTIVKDGQSADLCIINTCTVTDRADSKCRSMIRGQIRKNPHSVIVVAGCYSQMGYKQISRIPGVDVVIGNQQKLDILNFVDHQKNDRPIIVRDKIDKDDFTIQFVGDLPYNKRANLKIQDGCDFFCSFCIIPHARGRARSREFQNLQDEARTLAHRGVKEIILTGVNIGTYDFEGKGVLEVVDALDSIEGIDRIRISSIEPTTIPTELFDRMNDASHALLPFFHIPMQSGCDRILQEMKRKYTAAEYFEFIDLVKQEVNNVYLGSDIMVGFPGETVAEFDETCRRFLESPLHFAHVFTYSERKGTPAKRSTEHVPMHERNRRSLHLRRLSEKKKFDYYTAHLGQEMDVLIEDPKPTLWTGLTDNYIRVCLPREAQHPDLTNQVVKVRLDSIEADFVEGTLL